MESLLKFVVAVVALFVSGLCISLSWKWFVVPLGVPAISVLHGVGITSIPAFFLVRDPDKQVPTEHLLYSTFLHLVTLGLAYLIHLAM